MEDIIQVVNKEYVNNYKKKCKKSFVLYTIFAIIVQVAIAFTLYIYTDKLDIMIIMVLVMLLINSIIAIKKIIFSRYEELVSQLSSEFSKFEDIREAIMYSLYAEDDTLKIMFKYKEKNYCLVVEDYAVVIDELVGKDSAMM